MYVLTNRRNTIVIFGNTLKLILFSRGSNTSETNFGAAICPYIHRCVYLLVVNVKRRHLMNSMLTQMILFEVLRMDICDVANEHILLNIYITDWSVFYQFRHNNKGNIKAPHYWKKNEKLYWIVLCIVVMLESFPCRNTIMDTNKGSHNGNQNDKYEIWG